MKTLRKATHLFGLAVVLMVGSITSSAADLAAEVAAIHAFFAKMVQAAAKDGLAFSLRSKPAGGARGDMGWSSGTYVLKDKAGHVIDTGKYLSVSKKKDGKWLYVRDTWNSDGPPASTEPAAPPKK